MLNLEKITVHADKIDTIQAKKNLNHAISIITPKIIQNMTDDLPKYHNTNRHFKEFNYNPFSRMERKNIYWIRREEE